MNQEPKATRSGLSEAMRIDHDRLEVNARHLRSVVASLGAVRCRGRWLRFREELDAHLDAEEAVLLPAYERARPERGAEVRSDHAAIRAMADELGTGFTRGVVEEGRIADLAEALSRHGRAEEQDLYPWSECGVTEEDSKWVVQHIERFALQR